MTTHLRAVRDHSLASEGSPSGPGEVPRTSFVTAEAVEPTTPAKHSPLSEEDALDLSTRSARVYGRLRRGEITFEVADVYLRSLELEYDIHREPRPVCESCRQSGRERPADINDLGYLVCAGCRNGGRA